MLRQGHLLAVATALVGCYINVAVCASAAPGKISCVSLAVFRFRFTVSFLLYLSLFQTVFPFIIATALSYCCIATKHR